MVQWEVVYLGMETMESRVDALVEAGGEFSIKAAQGSESKNRGKTTLCKKKVKNIVLGMLLMQLK